MTIGVVGVGMVGAMVPAKRPPKGPARRGPASTGPAPPVLCGPPRGEGGSRDGAVGPAVAPAVDSRDDAPATEARRAVIRFYRCELCDRHHHQDDAAFAGHLAHRGERGIERATVGREYRR